MGIARKIIKLCIVLSGIAILLFTASFMFSGLVFQRADRSDADSGIQRDTVEFPEVKSRLVLEARLWGVAGNHEQTRIIREGKLPDSSNTQLLATAEIFYRKEGKNTLVIYAPYSSLINQLDSIGEVKIRIIPIKNRDSLVNLARNYAARGYIKLSAYDDKLNQ